MKGELDVMVQGLMFGPYGTPRDYEKAIEAALIKLYVRGWNDHKKAAIEAFDKEFCGTRDAGCIRDLKMKEKP